MNIQCKLVILILALTLDDQVHTGEIVGGRVAAPHSRPYMVLVEGTVDHGQSRLCGGFLLNEYFVMTAAHCKEKVKSFTVILGVHYKNEIHDKQKISVEKDFPHEDYDSDYKNDIMLLKMSSKAQFGKNVNFIPLADPSGHSLPQSCTVSGWGTTDKMNDLSRELMEVDVKLIEKCDKAHSYCSQGRDGPDVGDSGGPLVCDGKAYGVVSYKTGEDDQKIYRYAKIPDYRKWIDSIMKN